MSVVRLIGYWRPSSVAVTRDREREVRFERLERLACLVSMDRSEISRNDENRWPDVLDFVDPTWDAAARQAVADHLRQGVRTNPYRGLSPCRICGRSNGSAERTDGVYCWPEGLAHYVIEHQVRLPDAFVAHVLSSALRPDGLDERASDRLSEAWSAALGVDADPTWWLEQ